MSFHIMRQVRFSAAHHLTKVPPEHKCARNHGHSYLVEVQLKQDPNEYLPGDGMLLDYGVIDAEIRGRYDHRDLNTFPEFNDNPTAENLVRAIHSRLTLVLAQSGKKGIRVTLVRVSEEEHSWAEWRA